MIDHQTFMDAIMEMKKLEGLQRLLRDSPLPSDNPIYIKAKMVSREKFSLRSKWMKTKVFRAAVRYGSNVCFYTGLPCSLLSSGEQQCSKDGRFATIEHLHAKRDGGENSTGNIVIAMAWINHLLDCAPVAVKLHVRDEMRKIVFMGNPSLEERVAIFKRVANAVLENYRVDEVGMFPWDWHTLGFGKWDVCLFLKSCEEKIISCYGNNSAASMVSYSKSIHRDIHLVAN